MIGQNHAITNEQFGHIPGNRLFVDQALLQDMYIRRYDGDAYGVHLLDYLAEEVANRIQVNTTVSY